MALRLHPQPGPCCPWGAEVKHNSISGSRKPYRSALATCSASLRDGLRLTPQAVINTVGRNAKQHQGFAVIVSWFTLSKGIWICS